MNVFIVLGNSRYNPYPNMFRGCFSSREKAQEYVNKVLKYIRCKIIEYKVENE